MKRYRGALDDGWTRPVWIEDIEEGAPVNRRALRHRVLHSPAGFAWGYEGSGPAELARCLLWEHLGEEPTAVCYQAFKREVVARLADPHGDWHLDGLVVDDWLDDWRRRCPSVINTVREARILAALDFHPTTEQGEEP